MKDLFIFLLMLIGLSLCCGAAVTVSKAKSDFRESPNELYCDGSLIQKPYQKAHWFLTTSDNYQVWDDESGITFTPPSGVVCFIRQQAKAGE